jgi:hypothetical protein
MATDAVSNDARGAFDGLGRGLTIGLLRGTDLGRGVAIASRVTRARSRGWVASDEAPRVGTRVLAAALRGGRHALALAVAGRGRREGRTVAAAAAICADVIGADLAAGAISVAGTIVATWLACGLVLAEVVRVYARRYRGALAVVVSSEGVRTGFAAATGALAANTINTVALRAFAVHLTGRTVG